MPLHKLVDRIRSQGCVGKKGFYQFDQFFDFEVNERFLFKQVRNISNGSFLYVIFSIEYQRVDMWILTNSSERYENFSQEGT